MLSKQLLQYVGAQSGSLDVVQIVRPSVHSYEYEDE